MISYMNILNLDPGDGSSGGEVGHPTDTGTPCPTEEGSGPFNERNPLRVTMANTLMNIYRNELPFMNLAEPDDIPAPNGGDDLPEVECRPDPPTHGETIVDNEDGTGHITIYDTEGNDRVSGDFDAEGNQSDIHYTNQNDAK